MPLRQSVVFAAQQDEIIRIVQPTLGSESDVMHIPSTLTGVSGAQAVQTGPVPSPDELINVS
jgi:hypothetical protein